MISKIQKIILRSAFRQARRLESLNSMLYIQSIPHPIDFSTHIYYSSLSSFLKIAPLSLPDVYYPFVRSRLLSGAYLRATLRDIVQSGKFSTKMDEEFDGLRFINEQVLLSQMSSVCITRDVRCICTAIYDKENSNVNDTLDFIYYYRITIENCSSDPIQILARYWTFRAGEHVIEVPKYSPGLIGHKPILQPGESFQYMSSAILPQEEGYMKGSFLVVNLRKSEHFDAVVDDCPLKPTNYFR